MASSSSFSAARLLLVAAALVLLQLASSDSEAAPPLPSGLSFDFYKSSCPQAESIVSSFLQDAIRRDIGLAAALLRVHFHDCFVQGCDGSVLLDKTRAGQSSEKDAPPNVTLRPTAFNAINAVQAIFDALPPPTSNVTTLLRFLAKIGLDADDLVSLSGAHTLGIAHCTSFQERLFPEDDPTMNKWFAGQLKLTCPRLNTDNTTANDIRTPDAFDNKYYVDLMNRQGLFTSDQDLHTDARTKPIVTRFAVDQSAFFQQFVKSMVKMGQIQVLTGAKGQIRRDCAVPNAARADDDLPWSVVQTVVEAAESTVL